MPNSSLPIIITRPVVPHGPSPVNVTSLTQTQLLDASISGIVTRLSYAEAFKQLPRGNATPEQMRRALVSAAGETLSLDDAQLALSTLTLKFTTGYSNERPDGVIGLTSNLSPGTLYTGFAGSNDAQDQFQNIGLVLTGSTFTDNAVYGGISDLIGRSGQSRVVFGSHSQGQVTARNTATRLLTAADGIEIGGLYSFNGAGSIPHNADPRLDGKTIHVVLGNGLEVVPLSGDRFGRQVTVVDGLGFFPDTFGHGIRRTDLANRATMVPLLDPNTRNKLLAYSGNGAVTLSPEETEIFRISSQRRIGLNEALDYVAKRIEPDSGYVWLSEVGLQKSIVLEDGRKIQVFMGMENGRKVVRTVVDEALDNQGRVVLVSKELR